MDTLKKVALNNQKLLMKQLGSKFFNAGGAKDVYLLEAVFSDYTREETSKLIGESQDKKSFKL